MAEVWTLWADWFRPRPGSWAASNDHPAGDPPDETEIGPLETDLAPGPERQRMVEAEVVRLYDEHAESLFRYALFALSEQESAQDAVHDCFLLYFRYRIGGYRISDAKTWLLRALRNRVKADLVQKERAENVEPAAGFGRSPEAGPEELTRMHELTRMLPDLLSPRELECLRLRAEGLRYEEIAVIMNISSGTVGALINRAYKKLQTAFGAGSREQGKEP